MRYRYAARQSSRPQGCSKLCAEKAHLRRGIGVTTYMLGKRPLRQLCVHASVLGICACRGMRRSMRLLDVSFGAQFVEHAPWIYRITRSPETSAPVLSLTLDIVACLRGM